MKFPRTPLLVIQVMLPSPLQTCYNTDLNIPLIVVVELVVVVVVLVVVVVVSVVGVGVKITGRR